MIKKLIFSAFVFSAISSAALAGAAPYVGANIGLTNNTSSSSSFRGIPGAVMVGFGGAISEDIYLAAELFADIATAVVSNNTGCGADVRTTYAYGLSLIPGLMLSNRTMVYARLGAQKTRFNNLGSTVTGGQFGLGMQTSVTQCWDLRGEYDYVAYQEANGVTPGADQFKLGLIYKFG